jgi:methanogenic corrinoid protein MtbC1/DNA-binding XRE family transcriptional regulator
MSSFATTLRQLRKQRGLRQSDLAKSLGLTQATIANYEQGSRFPDEAVLNRLADQLGVSADALLGRSSPSGPNGAYQNGQTHQNALPGHAHGSTLSPASLDTLTAWLLAGDGPAVAAEFDRLRAGDWTVGMIHAELIQPLMYEIGRRWEAGKLDVYQEHAVSEEMRRQVARLTADVPANPEGRRFLGLSVSGNLHDLGIRMVSDLLRLSGWNTLFLGSNVPPASLIAAVRDFRPAVIGISAAIDQQLSIVEQTIYFLRHEFGAGCPPILVGGFAFSSRRELASTIGADAFALDGVQAINIANSLVS